MHRDGIRIRVFDEDPIHIEAIKSALSHISCLELVRGCIDLDSFSSDLILVNGECGKRCPNWFLEQLMKTAPESIILYYSRTLNISSKLSNNHINRLFFIRLETFFESLRSVIDLILLGEPVEITTSQGDDLSPHILGIKKLSPRELEVFCLLGKGYGAPEIAAILKLSKNTVDSHIKGIKRKLALGGTLQIRLRAQEFSMARQCRTFSCSKTHICPSRGESLAKCPHVSN